MTEVRGATAVGRLLSSPTAVAVGVAVAGSLVAASAGIALAGLAAVLVAACAVGTAAGYSTSGSV
jgi:hypothetical protein